MENKDLLFYSILLEQMRFVSGWVGWLSVIFVPSPIGSLLAFATYFMGQQTQATR